MAFTATSRSVDETFCGALCQHPSCWDSQRRIIRGVPHVHDSEDSDDSEDEGLPTQTVVNLLDGYGPDSLDYPPQHGVRITHAQAHRQSVSTFNKSTSTRRDSIPKTRAPNATPITPMQSTNTLSSGSGTLPRRSVGRVEVQEVFDVGDLQSNWQETFKPKKCYVWVPNPKQRTKPETQKEEVPESEASDSPPGRMKVRDLTDSMVPKDVQWEREKTVQMYLEHRLSALLQLHLRSRLNTWLQWIGQRQVQDETRNMDDVQFCDVWPALKHRRDAGDRRSPISFYTMSPISCSKLSRQGYHGLHELLDLPRDVLSQLVSHISENEMLDRERFADALLRTLPKLQRENTTVSLAYGNVLRQHKIPLSKKNSRMPLEPIPARQVFLLDDQIDHVSQINLASTYRSYLTDQGPPPREPPPVSPINIKTPLPDIPPGKVDETSMEKSGEETNESGNKAKMPSISLGLPSIPAGKRVTKPFSYIKHNTFDFTLGPVPSPPPRPPDKRPSSPSSTERSSIVVNMPTIPKDETTILSRTPEEGKIASKDSVVSKPDSLGGAGGLAPDMALITTPVKPYRKPPPQLVNIKLPQEQPLSRNGTMDSITMPRPPPTTPNPTLASQATFTPENTGTLVPIQETEGAPIDEGQAEPGEDQQRAQSVGGRSAHFAGEMDESPRPAASTPNESDPDVSVASSPSPALETSMKVHYERSENEYEGLVVIGRSTQRSEPAPSGAMEIPEYPPTKVPTGTPSGSPEPWPQVDEEAYRMATPSPRPAVPVPPVRSESEAVRMPSSAGEMSNSSLQSDKLKKIWQEGAMDGQLQSPGPPPPSPEPRVPSEEQPIMTQPVMPAKPLSAPTSSLGILKEETSESEMTISAKPPSNLDDISRINTPASYATHGLMSREPTMDMGTVYEQTSSTEVAVNRQPSIPSAVVTSPEGTTQDEILPPEQLLDLFDASQKQFDEELRSEYEKLSQPEQNDAPE